MIWLLYNLLIVLFSPLWVPWMIWRAKKRKEQPNWQERCGNYSIKRRKNRKRIWIHAVSVGEVIAARPILQELRRLLPDYEIVMTCTTSTGRSVALPLVGTLLDNVFYFPIDVPRFCVSAMMRVEPAVVAIMETELWMNFLSAAKMTGARTCLVNGRVSTKSFGRAKLASFFYKALLKNLDQCLMQTEGDAQRIRRLGAKHTQVLGNSKYDESSDGQGPDWPSEIGLKDGEHLIVVGSARGGMEENLILNALKSVTARILFAPRHIERAPEIEKRAKELGFDAGLRSREENNKQLVILDTLGELACAYSFADIAIIGGGFADLGGQNIIQPLAAGCPVICGPNMRNFREPFEAGKEAGAIVVAETETELRENVEALLKDKGLRERLGGAGRELVAKNKGASARYARAIADLAREFESEEQGRE